MDSLRMTLSEVVTGLLRVEYIAPYERGSNRGGGDGVRLTYVTEAMALAAGAALPSENTSRQGRVLVVWSSSRIHQCRYGGPKSGPRWPGMDDLLRVLQDDRQARAERRRAHGVTLTPEGWLLGPDGC